MTFRIPSYCVKTFWLLAISLFVLAGCKKKDEKSADILSHAQMVKALAQIYIAEQKVNNIGLNLDSAQIVFDKVKGRVFQDAGVTDSTFKKSYDYYMDRPKEFELIYTALVDTLNLYEQRLNITRPTRENPK
jgi:hypothetical protein